jgi:Secretion system C-terminal sorting domain
MKHLYKLFLLASLVVCSSFVTNNYPYAHNDAGFTTNTNIFIQRFYPNPATQFINFEFNKLIDPSYTLEVYSFIGKKMASVKINSSKLTVYFDDNYYRGLYIFQLRDKGGQIIESGKFQVIK